MYYEVLNAGFEEFVIKLAGGEPTLNWEICYDLINWSDKNLKNNRLKISYAIITNGTFLPETLFELLRNNKLGISISLDGIGKNQNIRRKYKFSNKGTFDDVNRNIEKLLNNNINPYILTTIGADNAENIIDIAAYCLKNELRFRFSIQRLNYEDKKKLFYDNEMIKKGLLKCYRWMENNLPKKSLYNIHKLGTIDLLRPKKNVCGIGSISVVINFNGDIKVCPQYDTENYLGNISENNFIPLINKIKDNEIKEDYINECKNCLWSFTCKGGCPLFRKYQSGSFNNLSPHCDIYKSILPKFVDLHAIQLVNKYNL